ncbi:MAG: hypothetical protein IJS66_04850 [Bacteroidales bacterium]|nr:hypothetical protein [Bacteroidales bacterium]
MKLKSIIAAVAAAILALSFTSCQKTDSGDNAGGYYIAPLADASGVDAIFILSCNGALLETFGTGIVYKNAANDKKAIDACDKIYEDAKHNISVSFELYFQNAVAEGQQPTKQVIKTYSPAE